MAKKRQQGYENALQSISDFIFSQQGKKGKVKPRRLTGLSGSDQLVRALAEIATKPGVRITDSMMDAINNSLGDANLIEFWVDKLERINKGDIPAEMQIHPGVDPGGTGRYRPKLKDISKLVKDPRKFVDAVYQGAKGEREWSRNMGFIGSLDGAAALLWAAKNKMPMDEALRLGYAATFRDTSAQMQNIAHKLVAENAGMQAFSADRARAVQAGKDIYDAMNSKGGRGGRYFGTMRDQDRTALAAYLVDTGRYSKEEVVQILNNVQSNKNVHAGYAGKTGDNIIQASTTGYRDLMITNLTERIKYLDPVADRAEIEKLQRSLSALSMWQKVYGGTGYSLKRSQFDISREMKLADASNQAVLAGLQGRIKAYEDEADSKKKRSQDRWAVFAGFDGAPDRKRAVKGIGIQLDAEQAILNSRLVRVQNALSATGLTPQRVARLQGEYNGILKRMMMVDYQKKNLGSLPWANFRIRMGHLSRAMDYYKNVGQGGLGGMLIGGGLFFNDAGGTFAPGVIGGQKVYWFNPKTKKTELYGQDFYAKGAHLNPVLVTPNESLNPQYASFANLYYLTPGSIWKTLLWNGEGFSFLAWRAQTRLVGTMTAGGNLAQINSLLGTAYKNGDDVAANIYGILDGLKNSTNPAAQGLYRSLGFARYERRLKTMSNLGRFIQVNMKGTFDKKLVSLGNTIKAQLVKLLKGRSTNGLWLKAVDQFGAGMIGIKQLIQEGITVVLQAIGLVGTGGTINAIIGAISYAATEAIFALSKPLMELATGLVWCVLATIALLIFVLYNVLFGSFSNVTSPYRHVVPGSAIACSSYNPDSGMYPDPTPNIPGTGYPPSNAACPMTFTLYCTQASHGNVSAYHLKVKAIDIGTNPIPSGQDVWHAPSDGRVIEYRASNICADTGSDYGGVLKFADSNGNVYVLMHVKAVAPMGSVKKGQAVAVTRRDLKNDGSCWTGPHFHLETIVKGQYVDSEEWYKTKLKCNVGTCWQRRS